MHSFIIASQSGLPCTVAQSAFVRQPLGPEPASGSAPPSGLVPPVPLVVPPLEVVPPLAVVPPLELVVPPLELIPPELELIPPELDPPFDDPPLCEPDAPPVPEPEFDFESLPHAVRRATQANTRIERMVGRELCMREA